MTANPIEGIGGIADTDDVSKADFVAWAKARVQQVMTNNAEIRTTNLALQQVVFVKTPGISWYLDAADSTTPDDDVNCVVSLDNKRFKPLSSIPIPTTISLGGVFALAPVANHFLTGIGTDGTPTHAQPSASNLSDGVTGTGAVVRSTSPALVTPVLGVAAATSINKVAITAPTSSATLTIADGKTLTASKSLTLDGTDGTILTGPSTSQTLVGRNSTDTLTNKGIDASANTLSNLTTAMFAANAVDTDITLAANSDTRLPSQKAIKSYTDNLLQGIRWKDSVACATTANITLSGEQTIDGVLTSASRVLVKNQSTASQNGIYVSASGAWTRSIDADTSAEMKQATVFVESGTVYADTQWTCTTASITLGSTSLAFAQVSGAGTYSAGTGLTLTGNQFLIDSTVGTLTGSQAFTNKTYNGMTVTVTTGTLTLTNGKTLSVSNTLTLSGTDGSSVAFGSGGTVAYVANKLSAFAATTSLELKGVISDETGSGALVFGTSPALTTPAITGGTVDSITSFGIRSTGAAFDLQMASAEVFTGNRVLSWVLGNAARTITVTANASIGGTNTGDQTITLTGDITGTGTGSFATTIGANKVTLGMMAQIATATFLGRTTASTGNVEALTVAQATALLNGMVGDTGTGGTKGLVPAPGAGDAAAGKFLKADGTYAIPAGGGGGSLSDTDRQNILLERVYQSKLFAGYRRFINAFADGYKDSGGVNAGSSSNYSVNTTSGFVAPTTSADTYATSNDPTLNTDGGDNSGLNSRFLVAAANLGSNNGDRVRLTLKGPASGSVSIAAVYIGHKGASAPNFDGNQVQVTFSGSATASLGAAATLVSDAMTFAFDKTKDFVIAIQFTGPPRGVASATGWTRYLKTTSGESGLTTVTGYTSDSFVSLIDLIEVRTALGTPNNMTVVTTTQTADSSVSNGRVLLEIDNSASPALNTDLTVEVTCNGGTNWSSATLSSVSTNSQGGRKVVETADTACTSGTSFAARIKTLNNKNVAIYGTSLTVH